MNNFNFGRSKGTVTINGVSYTGNNISVVGNKVIIDGKGQTGSTGDDKIVNITVQGDIHELKVGNAVDVIVTGNCEFVSVQNGNVGITGDVGGDVDTVNGDIRCGSVHGSVKTVNGDIRHHK